MSAPIQRVGICEREGCATYGPLHAVQFNNPDHSAGVATLHAQYQRDIEAGRFTPGMQEPYVTREWCAGCVGLAIQARDRGML